MQIRTLMKMAVVRPSVSLKQLPRRCMTMKGWEAPAMVRVPQPSMRGAIACLRSWSISYTCFSFCTHHTHILQILGILTQSLQHKDPAFTAL